MTERARPKLAAATALSIAIVLFLLSGRWGLSRVFSVPDSVFTAPRGWLVGITVFVALIPVARARTPRSLPPIGFLVFVGYFLLSVAWAPDADLAARKAIDLLLMAFGVLALRRLVVVTGVHATTQELWTVFGVILGGFALLGLAAGLASGSGRLAVLGGGPNVYGRNMGVLFVVCLGVLLQGRSHRALAIAGVVAAGLLVLLTGSRGAMAGLLAGVVALLYVRRLEISRTLLVFLLLGTVLALVAQFTELGQSAMASFEHRVTVLTFEQNYDSGRGRLRDAALALAQRHPITGGGLNAFKAGEFGVYPHNIGLEALSEGGLLGVLALLLALAFPLLSVIARLPGVDPTTAGLFMLHFTCAQTSGDFYDSRGVFLFAMLLGLQVATPRLFAGRRPAGPPTRPDRI